VKGTLTLASYVPSPGAGAIGVAGKLALRLEKAGKIGALAAKGVTTGMKVWQGAAKFKELTSVQGLGGIAEKALGKVPGVGKGIAWAQRYATGALEKAGGKLTGAAAKVIEKVGGAVERRAPGMLKGAVKGGTEG